MFIMMLLWFVFVGSSGAISFSKKSDMPYTCAFIQELYRFRIVGPLSLIHKASENTQLGKWIIPKGTKVGLQRFSLTSKIKAPFLAKHNKSAYIKITQEIMQKHKEPSLPSRCIKLQEKFKGGWEGEEVAPPFALVLPNQMWLILHDTDWT